MDCGRLRRLSVFVVLWICVLLIVNAQYLDGEEPSAAEIGEIPEVSSHEFMAQLRGLMENELIQDQLEIVDSQLSKLDEIVTKWDEESRKSIQILASMERVPPNASTAEADQILDRNAERWKTHRMYERVAFDGVKEVLLPHQIERLKQIGVQSALRVPNNDLAAILETPLKLKTRLGISDEKAKNLQPLIETAKDKFYKDYAKLKQKAFDDIAKELSAEEREKLDELVGPLFDFDENFRINGYRIKGSVLPRQDKKSDDPDRKRK